MPCARRWAVTPRRSIIAADAKATYRASAAAQRTQAYLDASKGCSDADANAMAEAPP